MKASTVVTTITLAVLFGVAAGGWASAQETPAPTPAPQPVAQPAPQPEPQPAAQPAPQPLAQPAPQRPAATAPTVPAVYAEGIRVVMDGRARYTGNVTMELTVHGRTPKIVSVDVLPKMAADDIAEDFHKELTLAVGSEFKVKRSGSRITIDKANKKAPNVSLKITNQSILGVSFLIDQD